MHRPWIALSVLSLASCFGRVPEIDSREADKLLAASPRPLVVDLRKSAAYEAGHLPGALSLTVEELDAWLAHAEPPRDRPILLACVDGKLAQIGGNVAVQRGYRAAVVLKGGMEAYPGNLEKGPPPPIAEELKRAPILKATWFEQLMLVVTGIGVKSTYMALTLLIIVLLWRSKERGLVLVRHSMVAFLFGEGMCAVNFLFVAGESDSIELFHGLGMVGMGMLLPWGLSKLADEHVVRYDDPAATCAVQRFCGHCWKREAVSCGLQRLFLFVAPAMGVTALLPWSASIEPVKLDVPVFDSHMIDAVSWQLQLVEFRVYPLVACALFFVSFVLLLGGRRTFAWSQPFFFGGAGFMTFSLMRFFLFRSFRDRIIWSDGWEEVTEFVAIAFVLFFLWVFRRQLGVMRFLDRQGVATATPTTPA
jgi:rhodanese-related sulfurtransferase